LVSTHHTVLDVLLEREDERCLLAQREGRPFDQPWDEGLEAALIER
jgi:hypothetical protein